MNAYKHCYNTIITKRRNKYSKKYISGAFSGDIRVTSIVSKRDMKTAYFERNKRFFFCFPAVVYRMSAIFAECARQACFYVYLWYNFNTNRKDGCTMGVIGIILGNIKNMRQAKKLRALGRDGLLALDDEVLYDAAVCMSRDGVIEIDDPKLPEQLVNIYALTQFESEVNNGGLCQFFVNSSGECAPYVSRALAAAGADGLKTLYERFLRENGIDPKDLSSFKLRSVAEYEDQVARFDYDSFDDAFYADRSIHTQIIAYIRDNVEVLL